MMNFGMPMNMPPMAMSMMPPLPPAVSAPAEPAAPPAPAPPAKYRKAPDAPKRFKSAFIIFSANKHKEIKASKTLEGKTEKVRQKKRRRTTQVAIVCQRCVERVSLQLSLYLSCLLCTQTTDIAKLVSEAWRDLDPEEKLKWENEAQKDKARYEVEKAMYKGPWKVLANKRAPKDPSAPKRPMSAFLSYSNKLRASLKKQNPNATNSDLSKMLSVTWKQLGERERKKFMDEEAELRAKYKIAMAEWRQRNNEEKRLEREEREANAMKTAEAQALARPAMEQAAALHQQAMAAQQQANLAAAATFQQQMAASGGQGDIPEQQQPTEGGEPGSDSLAPEPSASGDELPPEGQDATPQNQQENQDAQAATANGTFMNMGMPGMPMNPTMLANNPFLAQQFQQMQLQQFLGKTLVAPLRGSSISSCRPTHV